MGDDHGWDETGYNGHPDLKTPVLDEMARPDCGLTGSTRPTRRARRRGAACSPGAIPNRYGTFAPGWSLRPEEITIAQILAEAGYACGHFGKWHLGPVKAGSPTNPRRDGVSTNGSRTTTSSK